MIGFGQRTRAATVLGCVFLVGALAGIAFDRHHFGTGATRGADDEHNKAMRQLRNVVGLDDDQIEEVHHILGRHRETVHEAWMKLRPDLSEAMREVHTEIADLLRPEQRARFHEWLSERTARGEVPTHTIVIGGPEPRRSDPHGAGEPTP